MLTFEEPTHTYRWNNDVVISVTQALKSAGILDYSMIPQDVLLAAAARGTYVHKMIHYWLDGDLDMSSVDRHHGYLMAAQRFIDETRFDVHRVECREYHPLLKYAGTWDLSGLFEGRDRTIVDWKTGVVFPGHGLQLVGYTDLNPEPLSLRRMAVKLNDDGSYKIHEYSVKDYTRDRTLFRSALACAHWKMAQAA